MTAQDATKARKNAKARREKRKDGGDAVVVRSDRGGASGPVAPRGSFTERVARYFKGVLAESRRVTWPSKQEVIAGTISSVVILMVFSGWLGGLDYAFNKMFN